MVGHGLHHISGVHADEDLAVAASETAEEAKVELSVREDCLAELESSAVGDLAEYQVDLERTGQV